MIIIIVLVIMRRDFSVLNSIVLFRSCLFCDTMMHTIFLFFNLTLINNNCYYTRGQSSCITQKLYAVVFHSYFMFFVHCFKRLFKQATYDKGCSLLCIAVIFHSYFMFFVCCFRDVFKQATCNEDCRLLDIVIVFQSYCNVLCAWFQRCVQTGNMWW